MCLWACLHAQPLWNLRYAPLPHVCSNCSCFLSCQAKALDLTVQDARDAEDAVRKLDGFKGWVGAPL